MQLDKWHSNCSQFMIDSTTKNLNIDESLITSALGIKWDQNNDQLLFSYVGNENVGNRTTKRTILSMSSSLFDPLGLICPLIVTAKIILQELWLIKIDWDESVPQHIYSAWQSFIQNLSLLQSFEVPRFCLVPHLVSLQIHAFCDASLRAYGCCFYARCVDSWNTVSIQLLTAKSRVAPTKKLSLPKLELCGALILAKLYQQLSPIFKHLNYRLYCWTDSQIVLHWLKMHSATLSVFVGNRISKIQDMTDGSVWRHVPTKSNPADLVSRGCTVEELRNSIWINGPQFLTKESNFWPPNTTSDVDMNVVEKERRKSMFSATIESNYILDQLEAYSSYTRCIDVVAWMLRFALKANKQQLAAENSSTLSSDERQKALWSIVWNIQRKHFSSDIQAIQKGLQIKTSLKYLAPFLETIDSYCLLKVGGRLNLADLPNGSKHPVLLPSKSSFVELYVRHLHRKNYHAGAKTLMALIQQDFWIVNARDLARKIVRSCIHCVRYRPKLQEQVMGNLPRNRITPSRPFSNCGVDFCGPINTYLRIRGKAPYKTYVAIFICFSSKAVHLEAVSDLSTNAFLAALRRLIGRRGLPTDIYCDNATNFVGAKNHLAELKSFIFNIENQNIISNYCSKNFINFHFIPPRAPHFGGLWEAAVKVAKGHLHRSLMNTRLTFEELCTALVEVEAIMNSRPISTLSTDPNDLQPLTPGHFLIGTSLKALPTRSYDESTAARDHWAHISAVKQRFWDLWRSDYLNELQIRSKWSKQQHNVEPGTIVIVHEDNMPPQKWLLGRVVSSMPGKDSKVRVVDIQTSKGLIRRPIRKIAVLPA